MIVRRVCCSRGVRSVFLSYDSPVWQRAEIYESEENGADAVTGRILRNEGQCTSLGIGFFV